MGAYAGPNGTEDGLVLYLDAGNTKSYPGSGTAWSDLSGNSNNGTLINGPTYSSANGGAIVFDGSDDRVNLTTTYSPLSAPWTLSSWYYPTFTSSKIINTVFYSGSNPRTFSLYGSSKRTILGMDIDSSNNLYINTTHVNSNEKGGLIKFNSSYQLDTNYNTNFDPADDLSSIIRAWTIKLSTQYSGKIYACFQEQGQGNQLGLKRYNSDGSIDTSFNSSGAGINDSYLSQVHDVEEDSSGKLYVAGRFESYNGTTVGNIVKLNTDGTIDTSFNSGGAGFNNLVYNLVLDSTNNKLYAFGGFTSYNGTTANRIIRLNTDGSIDTSFSTGTGFSGATYIGVLDSNGKLLVGAFNASYNGGTSNRIFRLNSDGSVDTNFSPGTGPNSQYVSHIEIDSNGKIFVCGSNFSSFNGTTANDIVKLNSDGSIDTSFSTGSGFDSQVRNLKIDSNGKLIILGFFSTYDGTNVSGAILLDSDGTLNTDIMSGFEPLADFQSYFTDSASWGSLNLRLAGISLITESDVFSFFDGTAPINYVESMSSSGTYRVYVNGVLLNQVLNVPSTSVNIQSIGQGINGAFSMNGKISNISVYNKALTASEVQQNYNALKGRFGL